MFALAGVRARKSGVGSNQDAKEVSEAPFRPVPLELTAHGVRGADNNRLAAPVKAAV